VVGEGSGEDGQEEKGRQMSKDEGGRNSSLSENPYALVRGTGGLDQPDGGQEGPFINRQGVQAKNLEIAWEEVRRTGAGRCRRAESDSFRSPAGSAVGSVGEGAEGRYLSTSAGFTTPSSPKRDKPGEYRMLGVPTNL